MRQLMTLLFTVLTVGVAVAGNGQWNSTTTGTLLDYTTAAASGTPATDANGKPMTVVYLENLGFQKIGQNTNVEDVAWLRSQGYQVIEIDYAHHAEAVSPGLNKDIVAINNSLKGGSFCGCSCSPSRSYILMEGYRLQRDISYYKDDPTVYNYPDAYKTTAGDSLYLDLVYPANPSAPVPVVVTFSYSNSFATAANGKLTAANKHMRMNLVNCWGQFKDSFVEGASAVGFAWAMCDHPKYCDWGQGKYAGGANKSLGAIEVNPDAARKVKSAIRTVRAVGSGCGLNGDVVVTGFSRGSTAAALAVGDGRVGDFEDAARGRFPDESSLVQCAVLGPGMFDYGSALDASNEYTRMKTYVAATSSTTWEQQGALATITGSGSAPTLFYHNTDDYYADKDHNPTGLYATQARKMKERLDALGVTTQTLTGYSSGHAVPQTSTALLEMYNFMLRHVRTATGIQPLRTDGGAGATAPTFDLLGRPTAERTTGVLVKSGHLFLPQKGD